MNRIDRIDRLAIDLMLFSTCGEDPEILEYAKITEISPNTYHITYKEDNQFEGIDLKVKIAWKTDLIGSSSYFEYTVFDSVYADDGEFTLRID